MIDETKLKILKKTLETNLDLSNKFKKLVLLIKESDNISIEDAKDKLLPYIFKFNLESNAKKLDKWFDKKIPLFETKTIRHPMAAAGYKAGTWRRRGKGGALSMFPEVMEVDIHINEKDLQKVHI